MQRIKTTIILLLLITLITGIIYPLLVNLIAQTLFPYQANGSLIYENQQIIGSSLIGQDFQNPKYFWGRPSATNDFPYNASNSSGSNLGPSNRLLLDNIQQRIHHLQQSELLNLQKIPVDLVTTSASGLDPEISPLAALYQINRIASLRHISPKILRSLINQYTTSRELFFLGEPRVNILQLNIALDKISQHETS